MSPLKDSHTRRTVLGLSLPVAVIIVCLAGSAPDDRKAQEGELQGTWAFVSMESNGRKKQPAAFEKYVPAFEGDQWVVRVDGKIAAQTTFRLNPGKQPPTIDLADIANGRVIRGIYRLEGDTLTVCDRDADKGSRPSAFHTEPDSGTTLVVLKRVKNAPPTTGAAETARELDGKWRFVSMAVDGQTKPDDEVRTRTVVAADGRWTVSAGNKLERDVEITFGPKETPKTINFVDVADGRIIRGIYTLDADTLTICDRGAENGPRPKEFSTRPNSGSVLMVLRRIN